MSVPDRFHIAWQNDIAPLTLASSVSAETAYPLTNMQNAIANMPTVIDMTGETTVAITDVDSPDEAKSALCFAIHNHNFPAETTVRLRLYSAINQGGTVLLDTGAVDVRHAIPWGASIAGIDPWAGSFEDLGHLKTHFSLWFEKVEWKSFQIDITNSNGFTDNLLQMDKTWLAFAYCPTYGPNREVQSTQLDMSEHQRKAGGGMETVQREVRRVLDLTFGMVENTQRHTLRHVLDKAKMGGDVLITLDPNDAQSMSYETTSIYRRTNNTSFKSLYYNGNEFRLAVEEN